MLLNIGTFFYLQVFAMFITILLVILALFGKLCGCCDRAIKWLRRSVFQGMWHRFLMVSYLDFIIFGLLNIKHMRWDKNLASLQFSNVYAIAGPVVLTLSLLFIIIYLWRKRIQWNQEDFQE